MGKLLQGRTALITGASRGIGKAVALGFAEEGASLILAARNEDNLKKVGEEARKLGAPKVETHAVDLTVNDSVDKLALDAAPLADVLVSNAGLAQEDNILQGDPSSYEKMMQANLLAPMRLSGLLAREWVKRGTGGPSKVIIHVSSVAGIRPAPGTPAYATSKHGITGWAHSTQGALKEHNVRVVTIYPEYVASDMTSTVKEEGSDKLLDHSQMIQGSDIAQAALLVFRFSLAASPSDIVVANALKTPLCPLPHP